MGRNFSHTYFKFREDLYQDNTICHATGRSINYMSETTFGLHNQTVEEFELPVSQELYNELLQECHKFAGREGYGYFQNLGIVIVKYLNKVGFNLNKNPIDDGINCSEWMYYLLEEIYGKWIDIDPNLVTPDHVYVFLKEKQNGTT